MTERYVQATLISDLLMIPFSGSDTEVKSWTCLVHDLPIAWSGLTQNTLDLSTLNTDLAPDCHVVGWFFFIASIFAWLALHHFANCVSDSSK